METSNESYQVSNNQAGNIPPLECQNHKGEMAAPKPCSS